MAATYLPESFTFTDPTTLIGVIPGSGPTTGGIAVLIIGTNFRVSAAVTFGGVTATAISVLDENHISAIIPAHAVGLVNVVVTNTSGLFPTATLTNGFEYVVAAPTVTSILPVNGSVGGAEAIVITGTGFVATPTVLFGGTAGTSVVFISSTQLSCITPAHAATVVDITVTNPDTLFGTLYSSFEFLTASPFSDTGGWWWSADGLAGGTEIIQAPGVPKHPRAWDKLSPFNAVALGGFPAASVIFRNHIIYAGDDYTLGTDQPTIRIFDGIADRLMTRIPNTAAGLIPRAILSMLLINGIVYLTTIDSGTTSTNFAGRVFTFDPLSQVLTPLGSNFAGGIQPYALAWHMDRLWLGTNKGNGTGGSVYFIRPGIDTDWTADEGPLAGSVASLASYGGLLYVGTVEAAGTAGKVLKRDLAGVYTTSDTGGGAALNNGYLSMIKFGSNLYATYWDVTAPSALVRKFDNTTWTTAFTGSGLTIRPFMLSFLANKLLYIAGGGVGKRASLIRSSDGTSWLDLTAYLSGPVTETALPLVGIVGL